MKHYQFIERMRQGKNNVKIRHRKQFSFSLNDPSFATHRHAFGAMPVAA